MSDDWLWYLRFPGPQLLLLLIGLIGLIVWVWRVRKLGQDDPN